MGCKSENTTETTIRYFDNVTVITSSEYQGYESLHSLTTTN